MKWVNYYDFCGVDNICYGRVNFRVEIFKWYIYNGCLCFFVIFKDNFK